MVRVASITLAVAVAACSSSAVKIERPQIDFVQLYAPTDLYVPRGQESMTAEFGFQVTNRSSEPITLRRVDLQSVGDGGYSLRREDRPYDRKIAPGEAIQDRIRALAYFRTTPMGDASNEPVTLRATFYFDSPTGSFRQVVQRNIGQFSAGPR